ncbi:tetraacyldisaccharide 4'-kinase [Acidovorax sp. Root267]|uniref:tetraacyldisaccharide 4'-kinase n=1 Tax=Acidovorax sp. Root267 TaxID=1736505 RepID=UPI001F5B6B1A|nr:tetraacyldisaccharide 4'-kinase [Acidovorax sp. Root267]
MAAPGPQPPSPSSSAAARHTVLPQATGLQKTWQTRGPVALALWPVSLVYRTLVSIRRALYRMGMLKAEHPGRPVIVVGNVIAGGAGKTPVVIALVQHLQGLGLRPGVVSRGYGRSTTDCRAVAPDSPAREVGDEPALIARSCGVPVFVAPHRITAARALRAAYPDTDVIVCDDGLQHLALSRDLEVCIFNEQGVGNGFLLPAGPLREPWPRAVDFVLHAGGLPPGNDPAHAYGLKRRLASYALRVDGTRVPLSDLHGQPLHAVAAVARPEVFFAMLQSEALQLAHTEALPDHYDFDSWNRNSDKRYTLVCTEKDAVKLWRYHPDALAVPLQLQIEPAFFAALDVRLQALGVRRH